MSNRGGNQKGVGIVPGNPFAVGEDERRGGGKPGRSGRMPKSIHEKFRKILKRGFFEHGLIVILRNPSHPHWPKAAQLCLAYGYGVPKLQVEHSGSIEGGAPVLNVIVASPPNGNGHGAPHPSTS